MLWRASACACIVARDGNATLVITSVALARSRSSQSLSLSQLLLSQLLLSQLLLSQLLL